MTLNTVEKFFILIQDPEKSRFTVSDQIRSAGMIGSILLDISLQKNLFLEAGILRINSTETNLSDIHKQIQTLISNSKKPRKIKIWISKLLNKSRKFQKEILDVLEQKGIIKIEAKKFLFINYYKTHLVNHSLRKEIINEISRCIFQNEKADNAQIAILGIVKACKMYKIICANKNEIKNCEQKLEEILQSDEISQGVDAVIKELNAAIMVGIITSTIAVSVSSN